MRHLLWASIDNDKFARPRPILTFSEGLPSEKVKIYIAIADVDSVIKKWISD